jgi:hypothetical protein
MNADEIAGLVRSVLNTALTTGAAAAYVNGQQAAAIASGAGALVMIAWSVYAKWNQRLVPEKSVVTQTASTVAEAKALSIPAGK